MLKVGDKVNFQDDYGQWHGDVFTVTGFISDEEFEKELSSTMELTLLLGEGKTKRVTKPVYENLDEIRNVFLDWDCFWFPIQANRLRLAE